MVDKIKDDFDEELDLYMYKEVDGKPVKEDAMKEIKKNDVKKVEEKEEIDSKEKVEEKEEVKEEEVKEEEVKEEEKKEEIEKDVNEIIGNAEKKVKKNVNIPEKKKKSRSWIYTIVLILVLAGLVYYNWGNLFSQSSQITGQVIAVVNGEELTSEEFDEIYSKVVQQYPAVNRDDVLDQTVDKMLLLQEAKKENIEVDNKEVDEFIDSWLEQIKSTFTEEDV